MALSSIPVIAALLAAPVATQVIVGILLTAVTAAALVGLGALFRKAINYIKNRKKTDASKSDNTAEQVVTIDGAKKPNASDKPKDKPKASEPNADNSKDNSAKPDASNDENQEPKPVKSVKPVKANGTDGDGEPEPVVSSSNTAQANGPDYSGMGSSLPVAAPTSMFARLRDALNDKINAYKNKDKKNVSKPQAQAQPIVINGQEVTPPVAKPVAKPAAGNKTETENEVEVNQSKAKTKTKAKPNKSKAAHSEAEAGVPPRDERDPSAPPAPGFQFTVGSFEPKKPKSRRTHRSKHKVLPSAVSQSNIPLGPLDPHDTLEVVSVPVVSRAASAASLARQPSNATVKAPILERAVTAIVDAGQRGKLNTDLARTNGINGWAASGITVEARNKGKPQEPDKFVQLGRQISDWFSRKKPEQPQARPQAPQSQVGQPPLRSPSGLARMQTMPVASQGSNVPMRPPLRYSATSATLNPTPPPSAAPDASVGRAAAFTAGLLQQPQSQQPQLHRQLPPVSFDKAPAPSSRAGSFGSLREGSDHDEDGGYNSDDRFRRPAGVVSGSASFHGRSSVPDLFLVDDFDLRDNVPSNAKKRRV